MGIWTLLFAALGLAVFLEGLPYFVSPGVVRAYYRQITALGDVALRIFGFSLMLVGLLVFYFAMN